MTRLTVTALLLAGMSVTAMAQDGGDVQRGLAFARTTCSECHGVEGRTSLRADSPPFVVIANTPGMTALALKVWLQTPHRNMPNFILAGEDRDDVIAYITSLKTAGE